MKASEVILNNPASKNFKADIPTDQKYFDVCFTSAMALGLEVKDSLVLDRLKFSTNIKPNQPNFVKNAMRKKSQRGVAQVAFTDKFFSALDETVEKPSGYVVLSALDDLLTEETRANKEKKQMIILTCTKDKKGDVKTATIYNLSARMAGLGSFAETEGETGKVISLMLRPQEGSDKEYGLSVENGEIPMLGASGVASRVNVIKYVINLKTGFTPEKVLKQAHFE